MTNADIQEVKVDIRELIELASYSIIKGTIKPFEELKEEFSTHMEDMFLDEDLADHVGEPCYYLYDDCDIGIRACYLGEKCDKRMIMDIIDNLDNVIFDLLYPDILEQIKNQTGDNEAVNRLSCIQNYEKLYNYVAEHNVDISDYEISWLKVLGLNRQDLLVEFES